MKKILALLTMNFAILATFTLHAATISGTSQSINISSETANVHHYVISGGGVHLSQKSSAFSAKKQLKDGQYQYQVYGEFPLTAADVDPYKESLNNGRDGKTKRGNAIKVVKTGSFRIINGQLITADTAQKEGSEK